MSLLGIQWNDLVTAFGVMRSGSVIRTTFVCTNQNCIECWNIGTLEQQKKFFYSFTLAHVILLGDNWAGGWGGRWWEYSLREHACTVNPPRPASLSTGDLHLYHSVFNCERKDSCSQETPSFTISTHIQVSKALIPTQPLTPDWAHRACT